MVKCSRAQATVKGERTMFGMRMQAMLIGVTAMLVSAAVHAQTYPAKPVRVIVSAAVGGGTDIVTRIVAQRLAERLGQPFVVENRAGGGGSIGAEVVAKAAPDGYTLLMSSDALAVQASFPNSNNYDVLKDFVPVGLVGRTAVVLGVHSSVPVHSVAELLAHLKARPHKMAIASCGAGTVLHLASELLNYVAKVDLTHIGYRGCAPAMVDVISGQVPVFFNMIGNTVQPEKAGKVRILGVASLGRLPGMPALPTIAEALPGFEAFPWYAFFAPSATPKEIVGKLNAEITAAVKTAEVSERLRGQVFEPETATPEQLQAIIRGDLEKWSKIVREANLKLQ